MAHSTLPLEGKRVLITGATGSLGRCLLRRVLEGQLGVPSKVLAFSRDEAKQQQLRLKFLQRPVATDEVVYENFRRAVQFWIGDVRDYSSICTALREADVVVNAAALKQVPTCEYFPVEAVMTNVGGTINIVRAIAEHHLPIETVVGISTDKACKPVNVMGMTKALRERVFISANLLCKRTRFVCVRYGNVLGSRGSVIPLFHEQIRRGGPVTITRPEMTRFLLSLDDAVDAIFAGLCEAGPGEIYVPRVPSARVLDIARVLIGDRRIETVVTGIRPGEKVHEVLVSEEECWRTVEGGQFYVIRPALPELCHAGEMGPQGLSREYSSRDNVLKSEEIRTLLVRHGLMVDQTELKPVEKHGR